MNISAVLLLFLIYAAHYFLVDSKKIRTIEHIAQTTRFPRASFAGLFIALLGYVVFWLWLITSFIVFTRRLYEFSNYYLIIDIALLTVLFALVLKVISFRPLLREDNE